MRSTVPPRPIPPHIAARYGGRYAPDTPQPNTRSARRLLPGTRIVVDLHRPHPGRRDVAYQPAELRHVRCNRDLRVARRVWRWLGVWPGDEPRGLPVCRGRRGAARLDAVYRAYLPVRD